ncbi:S8 family serine peptidase [Paraneptunicella aestuarii]|uniref:S8 family serine peptidase n=1 Tax=Paraneptunicella aestuarii TaxID=2831148 RepID=UPI001E3A1C5C|nr:S8 family serine peptidase [Paraneptunicella aestuarii]UAA39075.1 S8 family serine peptidase [Paraneptunicella aestuarii]
MNIKHSKKFVGLGVSALTLVASSVIAAQGDFRATSSLEQGLKFVGAEASAKDSDTTGRYIIVFKKDAKHLVDNGEARTSQYEALVDEAGVLNDRAARSAVEAVGGKLHRTIGKQRMAVAYLDKKAFNEMRKNPNVETVSNDPKRYLMAQSEPFGIGMVQANILSNPNVAARKVCIIDTGYDYGHVDLPTTTTSGQANNSQVGSWNNDGHGHGTHVAGTIAALDNTTGVVGVYPGLDLHIVKIFNDSGSWTSASDLVAGIQQCADAGANIVSMSLGGGSSSTAERNAMDGFVNQGIMLIAAAGNDGNSSLSYPASYDAVMSVAAVDSAGSVASFSQYNTQVEIAAPGVAVNSTLPGDTYASWNGTSMATPHVSGVAALVWSFHQSCTNEQIREALQATSQDRGAAGKDNFYGWGIVKAADAHNYLNTWGCAGDPNFPPTGGGGGGSVDPYEETYTGLSGASSSWRDYSISVPTGAAVLTATMSGGTGDADLYTRFGSFPTTSSYDCRPYSAGNNETCTHNNPTVGTWYVSIRGYSAYSGVSLTFGYE